MPQVELDFTPEKTPKAVAIVRSGSYYLQVSYRLGAGAYGWGQRACADVFTLKEARRHAAELVKCCVAAKVVRVRFRT